MAIKFWFGGAGVDIFIGAGTDEDQMYGFGGNDVLVGNAGNDYLQGGLGADLINGGSGFDTASYTDSLGAVYVNLATGTGSGASAQGDTLFNIERVLGSSHDDLLVGDANANTLEGSGGNDTLKGGGGADVLKGGSGVDTASYVDSAAAVTVSLLSNTGHGGEAEGDTLDDVENLTGSSHNDTLIGDNDANTLTGNAGNDTLKGYGGNDHLFGSSGDDTLYGMDGHDSLFGGTGADTINGGDGADAIAGGGGADQMYGGDSANIFVFNAVSDSAVIGGSIQDYIWDFKTGFDKIDLSAMTFDAADLLVIDQVLPAGNFSHVGIDENNNGMFDAGEFAVTVHLPGGGFLAAGDLIL